MRFWRLVPDQLTDGVVLQEITDASFREHQGGVTSIAFSLDGKLLATASVDTTARLWEVMTDDADGVTVREILELGGHTDPLTDVAFNSSATKLATASRDHTVRVYTLDVEELLEVARSRATRGLTDEECQRFLGVDECVPQASE